MNPLTCYFEFSIHQSTHASLLLEETRKVIPDISFYTATPSLATFLPVDPMALPSQMGYPGLSLQQVQVHCKNPLSVRHAQKTSNMTILKASPRCPEHLSWIFPTLMSQMKLLQTDDIQAWWPYCYCTYVITILYCTLYNYVYLSDLYSAQAFIHSWLYFNAWI